MITENAVEKYQKRFAERYFADLKRRNLAPTLGSVAVESSSNKLDNRFIAEMVTGFSEALNGRVYSHREFDVIDGQVVDDDGEPLENMMLRARMHAYEIASKDPEMGFVVERFEAELDELREQQKMCTDSSGSQNTIIVLSPMTFELSKRPDLLKRGFQRPDISRSMVRISHWDGRKLHLFTLSLDYSDIQLVKDCVGGAVGYHYQSDRSIDVLRDFQNRTMSTADIRSLLSDINNRYGIQLSKKNNSNFVSNRTETGSVDLVEFVQKNISVIHHLQAEAFTIAQMSATYEDFEKNFRESLYNHLALMREILEGKANLVVGSILNDSSVAGERASRSSIDFSMCGDVVGGRYTTVASYESLTFYINKVVRCPNTACRKYVIIDEEHLKNGILHCKECKLTVDVCGDKNRARKYKRKIEIKNMKDKKRSRTGVLPKKFSFWF